jgi:hypothetical protein
MNVLSYNVLLYSAASKFANKTLVNNITKFFTNVPYEMWIVFFSAVRDLELFYQKDSGSWDHSQHMVCNEGWGMVILNVGELFSGVTTSVSFYFKRVGNAAVISETVTIYKDASELDERVMIEYDGTMGGKEYLAFEGIKDIQYNTIRNFYTGSGKGKKILSIDGLNRQLIGTRFPDISKTEYLKTLLKSETVKRLDASYVTQDVTILTETVKISNSELFTNSLELEYE